jgi:WD40 repeat protein
MMRTLLLSLPLMGLPLAWTGPVQPKKGAQPATDAHGDPLPAGAIARVGTLRLRHDAPIVALAWSRDSAVLASGSHDKTACLWDAKTGKLRRRITGHEDAVLSLALSSDRKTIATGSRDKTVRLWDAVSGKELWRSDAHRESVCSVAFSPDDKLLASAGRDGKVRLWEMAGGKQLLELTDCDPPADWQFEGHKPAVCSLAFSPDGTVLASGGQYQVVRLWDVKTGKQIRQWETQPTGVVLGVAFSPDGKTLASASATAAGTQLWDVATGKLLVKLDGDGSQTSGVHFSRDGKTLISCPALAARGIQYVRLSDATTGVCKQLVTPGSAHFTLAAVLSPDGKTLACAGYDQMIRLLDSATGKDRLTDVGENAIVRHIALSGDGKLLAASSWMGTITLHDAATGKALRELAGDGSRLAGQCFYPNDEHVLVSNAKNNLHSLHVASGQKREFHVPNGSVVRQVAMSGDARVLAFDGQDGSVYLWDMIQDRQIQRIEIGKTELPGFNAILALSPDGSLLVMTLFGRAVIEVWDTTTGKKLRELTGAPRTMMHSIVFSPDGYTVAALDSHNAWIWETGTGILRGHFRSKGDCRACSLAFAPDGRTLAIGKGGWNVSYAVDATGAYRYTVLFHARPPGEVDLWDIRAGAVYATFRGHAERVSQLAFSGDGKKLASLGWEGTALIWAVPPLAGSAPVDFTPKQLEALWAKLTGDDCPAAYAAHWTLASSPGPTVAFLKERLKPSPRADPNQVAEFRVALNSDKYAVRQKATDDLIKMGPGAEPLLRCLLEGNPTLELRQHVQALLAPLDGPVLSKERLGWVRALEVLERIGNTQALALLQALAKGPPGTWPTRQAQVALKRLTAKSSTFREE